MVDPYFLEHKYIPEVDLEVEQLLRVEVFKRALKKSSEAEAKEIAYYQFREIEKLNSVIDEIIENIDLSDDCLEP